MRIGELAKQAGISVQTIRFYERRGLLPKPARTASGYRQYQDRDLEIVRTIKRLQQFDCTLSEVRQVLALYALPASATGRTPYARGSHECLRESFELGEQKLKAINEKIRSLIAIRRDLTKLLREIRAKLPLAKKPSVSTRRGKAKAAAL